MLYELSGIAVSRTHYVPVLSPLFIFTREEFFKTKYFVWKRTSHILFRMTKVVYCSHILNGIGNSNLR